MGVEVGLEVVDFGEDELVDRFAPRHLQVRGHQRESVVLAAPAGRVLNPHAGVGGLGVPPHRVVVEVADHVHGPTRFGDGELKIELRGSGLHPGRALLPRHRVHHAHRHLEHTVGGRGRPRVAAQTVPGDHDRHRIAGIGHPDHLKRGVGVSDEQFHRLRRGHLHVGKCTRVTLRVGV